MLLSTKFTNTKRLISSLFSACLFAGVIVVSASSVSAHETAKADAMPTTTMPMSGMKNMGDMKSMSMTGDVDYDFAVNMRIHHQMAIDMSQAQLKNGKSPQLRTMATTIISAQKKEIATLDAWIAAHKKTMKMKP